MRVAVLRRYPIKSMLGESLETAQVTATGLTGDRALGLIDRDTGKVVSAKNPRLWRAMLTLTATGHPEITVTFPDGTTLPAEAAGQALSQLLGRPVTVAATPPPDATLDRSRPEQVLRQGITAITAVDAITLPGTTFHISRRYTSSPRRR